MALLRKVRAASLVETLTASVIIVVVFMIASLSFNNVIRNSVKANDDLLQNRLQEIQYLAMNGKISYPFFEEGTYWIISAEDTEEKKFRVKNLRNGENYEIELVRN